MLTYNRKLRLTKEQKLRIDSWINTCRCIYNMSIEIRKEAWKNKQSHIHKYTLTGQLKELRREYSWVEDTPYCSLEESVARMEISYNAFFKGAAFPKWATKKRYTSIYLRKNIKYEHENHTIRIPKLGFVRMFKESMVIGNIKNIILKKTVKGYFACIVTDAIKNIQCKDENQVLGLDVGIAKFYTDSNGNYCENHKYFNIYERKLRIENRSLSRKKKGSNSWKRQAHKVALLHNRIAHVRKDFLHKESTKIAKGNHTVILENLNVAGMVKNKNLSKHILDCGWGTFRQMLTYKTNVVAIDPKFTSQTCNDCGVKDKKSRISQSKFVCTNCGTESNADENAAKNILGLGKALIRQREAIACA